MGTIVVVQTSTQQGNMKSLLLLLTSALPHLSWGQGVKFGDRSSNTDVDQRFIFGLPSSTGNQFVDGALVGAAAGVIGGVVGKPIVDSVLGGGGCNPNCCGRRKRQTQFGENGDQKFFLPTGNQQCCNGRRRRDAQEDPDQKFLGGLFGGGSSQQNNCYNPNPCGRRKRQAGEEEVDTKLFGLFGNNNVPNCQPFNQNQGGFNQNQGGFNQGGFNQNQGGFNQGSNTFGRKCQCSYQHGKTDQGFEEAKCRRRENGTGQYWCYTTSDSNCSDAKPSRQHPNNPWSYQACPQNNNGK